MNTVPKKLEKGPSVKNSDVAPRKKEMNQVGERQVVVKLQGPAVPPDLCINYCGYRREQRVPGKTQPNFPTHGKVRATRRQEVMECTLPYYGLDSKGIYTAKRKKRSTG